MEYLINIGILFCIYGILALSLNMVVGMAGLVSLAQAAFFGIGAYATALGMTTLGVGFFTSVFIGILINLIISILLGNILSKFKGDYYAIVSAGLSIIAFSVLLNWNSLTNGPLGIFGIPRPEIFGLALTSNAMYFGFCLLILVLSFLFFRHMDRSSFGLGLRALREDEQLTSVMGYNTKRMKSIIFSASAIVAGIAGGLFASYIAFIEPSTFQVKEGIFLFTIIIIGGLASSWGSVLGALILLSLPEALKFLGLPFSVAAQLQQIIYGLTLVLIMVLKPKGIFGKYKM